MISEVVENYEIDGIQGDDRLPAMPVNSGYDEYTKAQYRSEHSDNDPPANEKNFDWVEWRAKRMTLFLKRLYTDVKSIDSTCIVSMAPSIYPWSKENYLQDWPTWLRQGYVDVVCPQVYRYDIEAYSRALREIVEWQVAPVRSEAKLLSGSFTSSG